MKHDQTIIGDSIIRWFLHRKWIFEVRKLVLCVSRTGLHPWQATHPITKPFSRTRSLLIVAVVQVLLVANILDVPWMMCRFCHVCHLRSGSQVDTPFRWFGWSDDKRGKGRCDKQGGLALWSCLIVLNLAWKWKKGKSTILLTVQKSCNTTDVFQKPVKNSRCWYLKWASQKRWCSSGYLTSTSMLSLIIPFYPRCVSCRPWRMLAGAKSLLRRWMKMMVGRCWSRWSFLLGWTMFRVYVSECNNIVVSSPFTPVDYTSI